MLLGVQLDKAFLAVGILSGVPLSSFGGMLKRLTVQRWLDSSVKHRMLLSANDRGAPKKAQTKSAMVSHWGTPVPEMRTSTDGAIRLPCATARSFVKE
jgi:hypothetical protein